MSLRKITTLIFIASLMLVACQKENKFVLEGKINDSDIKDLSIASGFLLPDFYNYKLKNEKNDVVNNNFKIEGTIEESHAFRFIANTGDISGLFFLDNNSKQSVLLDSLDILITPKIINSETNKEYVEVYLPLIENLSIEDKQLKDSWNSSLPDSLKIKIQQGRKRIRNEKDDILFNYIKNNPNSYVGMWLLAENFTIYGYKDEYHSAFNGLSPKLKTSFSGSKINEKMTNSSISAINGSLPDAELFEFDNTRTNLTFKNLTSKYTLIDFWATYCGPCIREIPNILKLYNSTNRDYFNVLAISIDSKKDFEKWNTFIINNNLPWKQFLDEEGELSKKLMINSVPANFLIDSNGKILLKNFSIDELKEFLELNQ